MAELWENKEIQERLILVGIQTREEDDTEESLQELAQLVKTAGGEVAGTLIQKRERVHPGTYLGTGKLEELALMADTLQATGVVCDDELSPAQWKNMSAALKIKVMDRTMVILDIFASRAVTGEGKIQVELAQLKYQSSRLVGIRDSLSRLGGGIGTRGPGEKKLEMDRRLIRERISQLKEELRQVEQNRTVQRKKRGEEQVMEAAIVGYTNAGKSTLLNALTNAGVLSEDKLFATLDTTTRLLTLPSGQRILLTDTVGFIRKLPHNLIEAFKSTLEEAKYADIILHVVDSANPQYPLQMHTVYDTLRELGVEDKIYVTLFNKQDQLEQVQMMRDGMADQSLSVSAVTGAGLQELKGLLEEIIRRQKVYLEEIIPYAQAGKIQVIRKYGELLDEEYQEQGIRIRAYVPRQMEGQIKQALGKKT